MEAVIFAEKINARITAKTLEEARINDVHRKQKIQKLYAKIINFENSSKHTESYVKNSIEVEKERNRLLHKRELEIEHKRFNERKKEVKERIKEINEQIESTKMNIGLMKNKLELAHPVLECDTLGNANLMKMRIEKLKESIDKKRIEQFSDPRVEPKPIIELPQQRALRDILKATAPKLYSVAHK